MADSVFLPDDAATERAGHDLARTMRSNNFSRATIYLEGELGAGKTTFARGFLSGWGFEGRVPSPTYTLIEPYELDAVLIYHTDLYRLVDPVEVENLGLAELPGPRVIMLVEWPERAAGRLPPADLTVRLHLADQGRNIELVPGNPDIEQLLAHRKD
jgi:tRNA threonylcarbamoyladenosine biosynthesis protein TsaE